MRCLPFIHSCNTFAWTVYFGVGFLTGTKLFGVVSCIFTMMGSLHADTNVQCFVVIIWRTLSAEYVALGRSDFGPTALVFTQSLGARILTPTIMRLPIVSRSAQNHRTSSNRHIIPSDARSKPSPLSIFQQISTRKSHIDTLPTLLNFIDCPHHGQDKSSVSSVPTVSENRQLSKFLPERSNQILGGTMCV